MRTPKTFFQSCMIMPFASMFVVTAAAQLPPDIVADRWIVRAEWQAGRGEFEAAMASLDEAVALRAEHGLETPPAVWYRQAQVELLAAEHARALESLTRYVTAAGRDAEHYWAALELLDSVERQREVLEGADRARREGLPFVDPLEVGGTGPLMATIPAGTFRMGCLDGRDCYDDEFPLRDVTIPQPFAMSVHEVTFEQWDACAADGGCGGHRPRDEGWGRADRPVIDVSWEDAQRYVSWLSSQTGAQYRLPSEAEWEYAARAGTDTAYHWGEDIGQDLANCDGCGSQWDNDRTAPVGSFPPNGFGLYDMHGNVAEWVEDCWNDNYTDAPTNGNAWVSGDCSLRVWRGGSWYGYPEDVRSSYRDWYDREEWDFDIGFRVVRTLDP